MFFFVCFFLVGVGVGGGGVKPVFCTNSDNFNIYEQF